MAREKEGYEVVAERLLRNLEIGRYDADSVKMATEHMSILRETRMPASFARWLTNELGRFDFISGIYRDYGFPRMREELLVSLRDRRDKPVTPDLGVDADWLRQQNIDDHSG